MVLSRVFITKPSAQKTYFSLFARRKIIKFVKLWNQFYRDIYLRQANGPFKLSEPGRFGRLLYCDQCLSIGKKKKRHEDNYSKSNVREH